MKTKRTPCQTALEWASIIVLIGSFLVVAVHWRHLPAVIPAHYNIKGEVNRWGSKSELLILPAVSVAMYTMITLLLRVPKLWNMPVEATKENAEKLYSKTKTMILLLKLEVLLIFLYLAWAAVKQQALSAYFMPVSLVAIFGTLAYYIYQQVMIDRNTKRVILIDSEVTRLKNTFPVSKYWLTVPVMLVVILFLFSLTPQGNLSNGLFYVTLIALEVVAFCLLYFMAANAKSVFYSSDDTINMALNRMRIRRYSLLGVLCAYNSSVSGVICFSILIRNGFQLVTSVAICYFAHVALALLIAMHIRRTLSIEVERLKQRASHMERSN